MASYSKFEELMLIGAYIFAERTGDDMVAVKKILGSYKIDGSPHWIDRAIAGLVSSGYLNDMRTIASGLEQELWLSAAGARHAESLMRFQGEPPIGRSNLLAPALHDPAKKPDLPAGVSEASGRIYVTESDPPPEFGDLGDIFVTMAPSSDGLVRFDHNSDSHRQAVVKVDALSGALATGNDVGNMTPEGVVVAAAEVDSLRRELDGECVRATAFWDRAKSLLGWIGKEAAGAVVGLLAVAALAAIAVLLGLPVPI